MIKELVEEACLQRIKSICIYIGSKHFIVADSLMFFESDDNSIISQQLHSQYVYHNISVYWFRQVTNIKIRNVP